MKTKLKNQKSELQSRPEQLSTSTRPSIDLERRKANRSLNTERLLGLLRTETPHFYSIAEVVGKWVWIRFTDRQPSEITRVLAELGFHWNKARQTWQHPCGVFRDRSVSFDPRKRYGSYFASTANHA